MGSLALGALALGGCGSAGSSAAGFGSTGPSTSVGPGGQLEVVATSFSFKPKTITVKVGDAPTLVLVSKDLPHDFTVSELGIQVHTDGGHTVRKTVAFDKPGTYTFFCSISGHREAGMTGTLTVQ